MRVLVAEDEPVVAQELVELTTYDVLVLDRDLPMVHGDPCAGG